MGLVWGSPNRSEGLCGRSRASLGLCGESWAPLAVWVRFWAALMASAGTLAPLEGPMKLALCCRRDPGCTRRNWYPRARAATRALVVAWVGAALAGQGRGTAIGELRGTPWPQQRRGRSKGEAQKATAPFTTQGRFACQRHCSVPLRLWIRPCPLCPNSVVQHRGGRASVACARKDGVVITCVAL